jgi:hypothetical protein
MMLSQPHAAVTSPVHATSPIACLCCLQTVVAAPPRRLDLGFVLDNASKLVSDCGDKGGLITSLVMAQCVPCADSVQMPRWLVCRIAEPCWHTKGHQPADRSTLLRCDAGRA